MISDADFLYDHCRCPKCYHDQTKQRLKPLPTHPPAFRSVQRTDGALKLDWDDGHVTEYPWDFLAKAAYNPPIQSRGKAR